MNSNYKNNNYLELYINKCLSGEIIVGHELKLQLIKLKKMMENDNFIFNTEKADMYMDFMENCLKFTKSPFYGKPFILLLWEKAFVTALYSFYYKNPRDGVYIEVFRKCLLLIARKNGKSEICAALEITELVMGGNGLDIVCSSNDDNQANILYEGINEMRLMIDPNSEILSKNIRYIQNKYSRSKIFKISDRTKNKEGRNIDFAVCDEIHELKDDVILVAIEQSQSLKDNPKLIFITTEGYVDDGALDKMLIKYRKILNGEEETKGSERILVWLYTQDSEDEIFNDPTSWYKANPSLGEVKKISYIEEMVDEARVSKIKRIQVLSKDFNFKQSSSTAWLERRDYDYDTSFNIEDFKGCYCLGAVDLAETNDLTNVKILLMRPNDNKKYILSHYFIPQLKYDSSDNFQKDLYNEYVSDGILTILNGSYNDLSSVADYFFELYSLYDIYPLIIGYDQRFSRDFINRLDEYNMKAEIVNQNADTLSFAINLVENELKNRLLYYNNNKMDKKCFENTSLKLTADDKAILVRKSKNRNLKIDGSVTLVILYEIYRRYRTDFMTSNGLN